MTTARAASLLVVAALLIGSVDVAVLLRRDPGGSGPSTGSAPAGAASESVDEQLERVARTIEDIRELDFEEVPEPTYLPPDELAQRAASFVAEYSDEDAEVDERLLTALGAIPTGTDLRAMLRTALSEQVAGFYDPRSDELVVGTDTRSERLGPLDEITLAHELEHALADQALGLPVADDIPERREDAAFAQQALVEGDATLTMVLYAEQALSVVDQARLLAEQSALTQQLENLTAMPHVIQRTLTFPYEEGTAFATTLREQGGWETVDEAYRRLPSSTLQILRPDLYLAGEGSGTDPRDVGEPGGDWQRRGALAIGAADLLFLFEAPGDDPARAIEDPLAHATAWRGGEAVVYADGDATAVGIALEGADRLCSAVGAWYAAAFPQARVEGALRASGRTFDGPTQDAFIRCGGDDVRVGIAPDLAAARALAA